MQTATTAAELAQALARLRAGGRRIAFVPTLGNLHAGHARLVERARDYGPVVASVYVNPLQFGAGEDFERYPRTPEADRALLEKAGVSLLFMPQEPDVYPRGREAHTTIEVPDLSDILCGAARPGHFRGVATVVQRLFALVRPEVALFGKKDYQQWLVVRRMTEDLGMPVEIVGVDTVRAPDGLALSSRNRYLTAQERALAPRLYQTLCALRDAVRLHGYDPSMEEGAVEALRRAGFRPDYVAVRSARDLSAPQATDTELVALAAAWLGGARLIDNLEFGVSARR